MFRGNKVEPVDLEEGVELENEKEGEGPLSSVSSEESDRPLPGNHTNKSSPPTPLNASVPATPRETSHRPTSVTKRLSLNSDGSVRRSSTVAYYMDRVQSKLRKSINLDARKQLFQTQKFFTPFKRWLFGFYGHFEPPLDLAVSDLKDNRSGGWMLHPRTMCCVHIIQVQLVIYRKASFYRVLETYFLTGLPLWGTFLFQGSILYFLYDYLTSIPILSTGFCTNSFLLEYTTIVVFCMYMVVENTERFEANALVALSPIYGRLTSSKKSDIEAGDKPTMNALIMVRHFSQFMKSKTSLAIKIVYLLTLLDVTFDLYVFVVITYIGCKYIAMSNGVSDLIQSAVALSFIWTLGEVVFKQTYSASIIEDLQSVYILLPSNESDWQDVPDPAAVPEANRRPAMVPPSAFEAVAAQLGGVARHPTRSTDGSVHSNKNSDGSEEGESEEEQEQNLEEHVLFQNNNIIYNAFFVICMVFLPVIVAAILIPVRLHYCGTGMFDQWTGGH